MARRAAHLGYVSDVVPTDECSGGRPFHLPQSGDHPRGVRDQQIHRRLRYGEGADNYFAGFNCATGELITLSMNWLSNTHQRATVMVHHDVIIELRDTGADVLV